METLPTDDIQLHIVADTLRRRLPLVLTVMLLMTGAVGAYALRIAPTYTASAQVLLRPIPGNAFSPDSAKSGQQVTVAMATEAGLVNSPGVTQRVSKMLKTDVAAGSAPVSVSVPANTQFLQIQYTDSSPSNAQAGAQAFADGFLAFREGQTMSSLSQQLDILQKQSVSVADDLKKESAAAALDKPPANAAALVQLLTTRQSNLQDMIGQLKATDSNPGSVVTLAAAPTKADGIGPGLLMMIAALLGLTAGIAIAIWRERSDDRIRAGVEISVVGVPLLSSIPNVGSAERELIKGKYGDDVLTNAYRRARAGIMVAAPRPAVVAVSAVDGTSAGDPLGLVVANLAFSLISADHAVCVVDAQLGMGDLAGLLGLPFSPGLSDILARKGEGDVPLLEQHQLRVLPSGQNPERTREIGASANFVGLIETLRQRFDYVLIAAPVASSPEGSEVALAADGVVLVLTDMVTTHEQVASILGRARQLGVAVLGVVAVPRRGRRRSRRRSQRLDGNSARELPVAIPPGSDVELAGTTHADVG